MFVILLSSEKCIQDVDPRAKCSTSHLDNMGLSVEGLIEKNSTLL